MRSMTGFGSGEAASEHVKVSVEITSVNRKQADIVVHLPKTLASLEPEARRLVLERIPRGRVTVQITVEPLIAHHTELRVDDELANQYIQALRRIGQSRDLQLEMNATDLLRAPGIFELIETGLTPETVEPSMVQAVATAIHGVREMQEREGASLRQDLESRLTHLDRLRNQIAEQAPKVKRAYREQLHKRLRETELELPLDDERILKEVALFAERCDISEELTRLESHFQQFRRYFDGTEPCGRSLDFLCQEVHREFNTIGAKANNAAIAQCVVESKTELEKIREQVQNVQ